MGSHILVRLFSRFSNCPNVLLKNLWALGIKHKEGQADERCIGMQIAPASTLIHIMQSDEQSHGLSASGIWSPYQLQVRYSAGGHSVPEA